MRKVIVRLETSRCKNCGEVIRRSIHNLRGFRVYCRPSCRKEYYRAVDKFLAFSGGLLRPGEGGKGSVVVVRKFMSSGKTRFDFNGGALKSLRLNEGDVVKFTVEILGRMS